jgi:membrane-anchored protein YejM (alkaline phosphatase superfamily)
MHFVGGVLGNLLQPDALATIGISRASLARESVRGLALALLVAAAVRLAWRASGRLPPGRAHALGVALLALVVADRLAYAVIGAAQAEARFDVRTVLPYPHALSPRLPRDLWPIAGGHHHQVPVEADMRPRSTAMRYPAPEARSWTPRAPARLNVVIIGIEGLRFDMLDAETMPNAWALSSRSRNHLQHYSASNCTYVSLFSLLYGLSPRLWEPIRDAAVRPFTYELLRRMGYTLSIASSIPMKWFGIDKLAFPPELALTESVGGPDFDARSARELVRFIQSHREQPYFSFLFLNGTHMPYFFPAEAAVFEPYLAEMDLGRSDLREHRQEIVNRYRNALHYLDGLVGEILEALRASGQADRTIVVITGDHGESFFEDGTLSHTGLLSTWQLHVPLVMYLPGKPPEVVRSVSSHVDVMPTVLAEIGCELPPGDYSDGRVGAEQLEPKLAAQCGPLRMRLFAEIDREGLTRFEEYGGWFTETDAETLDGKLLVGPEREQSLLRAQPRLLTAMRKTAHWWPAEQAKRRE